MGVAQVSLGCKTGEEQARAEPVVYTQCLDEKRPCGGGGILDGSRVEGTAGRRGDTLGESLQVQVEGAHMVVERHLGYVCLYVGVDSVV